MYRKYDFISICSARENIKKDTLAKLKKHSLNTDLDARTAQKSESQATKTYVLQDWVLRLGTRLNYGRVDLYNFQSYFSVTETSKSQLNRNGLLRSLSTTQSTTPRRKRPVYSFDERTILVAFILVIVTLLIITIAMFKLAGSIALLSDRLLTLEYLLERCATSQCLAVYENET